MQIHMDEKIISKENFAKIREKLRKENKKIVLCHGVFDLLHYGHIEHLQEARAQGDVLVVSVTAAKFVNKGPGRPYFNDNQRMTFLANLECVDYVLLSEAVTVHNIVEVVQPDIYVKGQEYASAENDVTGNISSEQEIVEKYGGRIYFTKGEVYSSTKILNNFFGTLPEDVLETSRRIINNYGENVAEQVKKITDSFEGLNVLVVGDIIIDDYIFCTVQGLTMKDAAMSTRYDFKERYAGGSLAITRHLANFVGKVTFLSMAGCEQDIANYIEEVMSVADLKIIRDRNFITPVKCRYLKRNPIRQEYEKLFSVNKLLDIRSPVQVDKTEFYKALEENVKNFDLVVVCDYGHGLIDKTAISIIEKNAKFLALNCQTNSANHGMNIITKYSRADSFVVDVTELNLACGQSSKSKDELLEQLAKKFHSRFAWLTTGAKGAIGVNSTGEKSQIPAITLRVKDTVGAGDAFYSIASLCAVKDVPVDLATLMSNIAGAIKTNLVGNSHPVSKVDFLKFLNTVLNV